MATRTLSVVISGDTKGITQATRQAEGSLDRLGKSGSKTLSHLKTGMLAVGAAAGAGLVLGLKKSAEAAIESEKANARLRATLRAVDASFAIHGKHIQEVIDKHSQLSGFDDEDLGDAFTNIVRVTGDVNKSLDLMAVASDVARGRQMDLGKASELVGKVAGGNIGILSRYGIQFQAVTTATDRLKESSGKVTDEQLRMAEMQDKAATKAGALAALQGKFAGQAEAYGKTTAGAQDRARVAFENLGETIGARVTPIIARVAEGFNTLVRQITLGQGPGGRIRAVFERIAGEAVGLAGTIQTLVRWFQRHRTATTVLMSVVTGLTAAFVSYKVAAIAAAVATKTLAAAMVLLNIAMRANPIGIVVTALIALGAGLVVAYKRSETFRKIVDTAFTVVKKRAQTAAAVFTDVLLPAFRVVVKAAESAWNIMKKLGNVFGGVARGAGKAADFLNPFGDGLGKTVQDMASIPRFGGGLMGARPELAPIAGLASRFGLGVSSGLRPGARTSTGRQSWHATGEALDVSGPASGMMGFARFMSKRAGSLAELIYTPLGAWSNGSRYTPTGKIAADHYDHVHVAMDVGAPGQGDGIGRAVQAARSVGLMGDRLATMVAIAGAESGYNPRINAAGPEDSRGLWQINVGPGANTDMLRLGDLYDPMVNAKAMKIILGRQGLNAWSVYSSGKYRSWLGRARAAIAGSGSLGGGSSPAANRGGGGSGVARPRGPDTAAGVGDTGGPAGQGRGGGLGFEGKLARNQVRQAKAEARDDLSGMISALVAERRLKRRRLRLITKVLAGTLSRARRTRLLQEQAQLISEIGDLTATIKEYKADRTGGATTITGAEALEAGVDTSAETGGDGAATETGGTAADTGAADLASALDALRAEMAAHRAEVEATRKFAERVQSTENFQLKKYLADVISGQVGGYLVGRSHTPGSGVEFAY